MSQSSRPCLGLWLVDADVVNLHERTVDCVGYFSAPANDGEAEPNGSGLVTELIFFAADFFAVEVEDEFLRRPFQAIRVKVAGEVVIAVEDVELGHLDPFLAVVVFHAIIVHHCLPAAIFLPTADELNASDAAFFREGEFNGFRSIRLSDPAFRQVAIDKILRGISAIFVEAAGFDFRVFCEIDESGFIRLGGF